MKIDLKSSELQTLLAALEFYTKAMNHDYVESGEVDWMAGDEAELSDGLFRRISVGQPTWPSARKFSRGFLRAKRRNYVYLLYFFARSTKIVCIFTSFLRAKCERN